jgi:hypothetical protein
MFYPFFQNSIIHDHHLQLLFKAAILSFELFLSLLDQLDFALINIALLFDRELFILKRLG